MKVLITGGAGFIGSSLADALLSIEHSVLIIDNYITGKKENNKLHVKQTIVNGSITDTDLVNNIFTEFRPDIVVHAATSYIDPENYKADVDTNINGTINIVHFSIKFNVKRLVFLQTSLCYGLNPIRLPITTDQPLFGATNSGGSSYAITKTTAELFIELSKINFISFRLANVYGPRNLSGPLPNFYMNLTSGTNCIITNTKRDFIFIDDLVSILLMAIDGKGTKKYYNVSTGTDHSIEELFNLILKNLGQNTTSKIINKEMGEDDTVTILLDPKETEIDFNWKANVSFEDGVNSTIQWYKKNPVFATYTHLKSFI